MKMVKELNMAQIIQLIEQCKYLEDEEHNCTDCPLRGECLYYCTADDSELYEN